MSTFVTIREAAVICGVHPRVIHRLIRRGHFPTVIPPDGLLPTRLLRSEVEEFKHFGRCWATTRYRI